MNLLFLGIILQLLAFITAIIFGPTIGYYIAFTLSVLCFIVYAGIREFQKGIKNV
jgi:hypothetical protein